MKGSDEEGGLVNQKGLFLSSLSLISCQPKDTGTEQVNDRPGRARWLGRYPNEAAIGFAQKEGIRSGTQQADCMFDGRWWRQQLSCFEL